MLFESFYLDSNYNSTTDYDISPFYTQNRYTVSPGINVELGRWDSIVPILNLDYCKNASFFPIQYPAVFQEAINLTCILEGRIEFITDRDVSTFTQLMVDYPIPPDNAPPVWDSSTNGFCWVCPKPVLPWMAQGTLDSSPASPRIGIQYVVNTTNNSATIQWDIALDQTRPVLYNIYIAPGTSIDFNNFEIATGAINVNLQKSVVFPAVHEAMGQDYIKRNVASGATACPYQFTLNGLQGDQTYTFAVRAEDSTQGLKPPANSRTGPSGGLEELNNVTITVLVSGVNLSDGTTLAPQTPNPTPNPTSETNPVLNNTNTITPNPTPNPTSETNPLLNNTNTITPNPTPNPTSGTNPVLNNTNTIKPTKPTAPTPTKTSTNSTHPSNSSVSIYFSSLFYLLVSMFITFYLF